MDYAEGLARMVRCRTISVKGESACEAFSEMKSVMRELFPHVFSTLDYMEFSGSMCLRWKGLTDADPVMLMAHQDVVAADESEWKHPPFAGEISDGRVWGRGTRDTKCSLYASFQAVEELLAEGFVPSRDIYLTSSCDEEIGGTGAASIASYLKEKGLNFFMILDEGGCLKRNFIPGTDQLFAAVGCGEKGSATFRFIARSVSGHAMNASADNPVIRLSRLVSYLGTGEALGSFSDILTKEKARRVAPFVSSPLDAEEHVLISYTMMQGSDTIVKVPTEASVCLKAIFPETFTPESLRDKLAEIADDYRVEVELVDSRNATSVSSYDTDSFRLLESVISDVYPEAVTVPFVLGGGTDARNYCSVSSNIFRFLPMVVDPDQQMRVHGIDENVSIDRLAELVRFFRTLVSRA